MTQVPFGAASSPFLLAATLQHHFNVTKSQYPDTAACMKNAFHVDDLVGGTRNEVETLALYQEASNILEGMQL